MNEDSKHSPSKTIIKYTIIEFGIALFVLVLLQVNTSYDFFVRGSFYNGQPGWNMMGMYAQIGIVGLFVYTVGFITLSIAITKKIGGRYVTGFFFSSVFSWFLCMICIFFVSIVINYIFVFAQHYKHYAFGEGVFCFLEDPGSAREYISEFSAYKITLPSNWRWSGGRSLSDVMDEPCKDVSLPASNRGAIEHSQEADELSREQKIAVYNEIYPKTVTNGQFDISIQSNFTWSVSGGEVVCAANNSLGGWFDYTKWDTILHSPENVPKTIIVEHDILPDVGSPSTLIIKTDPVVVDYVGNVVYIPPQIFIHNNKNDACSHIVISVDDGLEKITNYPQWFNENRNEILQAIDDTITIL